MPHPNLVRLLIVTGTIAASVAAGLAFAEDEQAVREGEDERPREVVDLSPDTPAAWSFRYFAAPVVSLFRGPSYMYSPREIEIETTPADGVVDLFYVRSGFQKRFEQAESPVTVILPSRLAAGPRDAFTVRAFAPGYRQQSVTRKLGERFDQIQIDLEPLPNRLDAVSHRYFAGRSSIAFLTPEALTFRVQEADDGYGVILNETAIADSAQASVDQIRSPLIAEGYSQQLGEDLMVKLIIDPDVAQDGLDVRSRQQFDAPRDLYVFVLDLVPSDNAGDSVKEALDALAAISPGDVTGCHLAFDDSLRGALDPGALARALRPRGAFTDRYLRAAMRRLGEVSVDGVVDFVDGTQLRPETSIELEMAIGNAATAKGYLALLRAFVDRLEPNPEDRTIALKSLVAPEEPPAAFQALIDQAAASERACRAG